METEDGIIRIIVIIVIIVTLHMRETFQFVSMEGVTTLIRMTVPF